MSPETLKMREAANEMFRWLNRLKMDPYTQTAVNDFRRALEAALRAATPAGPSEREAKLEAAVVKMLPIVSAAYWDEHCAGAFPGSGFNNRAQHRAGQEWGWRNSAGFQAWEKQLKALLPPAPTDKEA